MKKLLLLLLFLTPLAFAAKEPLTPATELNRYLSLWETLSADYQQKIVDTNGRALHNYTGRMYVKRPNQFRWVIKSPEPQTIVSDGKNLWIYDEELAQVTVQPVNEQLSETPAMFLSGSFKQIEDGFKVSELKAAEGEHRFLLVPKKEDNLIERIEMTFNKDFDLTQMKIRDVMQQTTEIKFSNIRTNPDLSKHMFIFTVPKNVDVIGETR